MHPLPDSPLARLQRIVAAARTGAVLEASDVAWLADGAERLLDGRVETIDAALALKAQQSFRRPVTVARLAERNAAIRRMARFFGGTTNQKARCVAREIRRYQGAAWPRDRRGGTMPASYGGGMRAELWLGFTRFGTVPSSWRQIFRVLQEDATDKTTGGSCQSEAPKMAP